jgi:uncharacterized MnhB-related membrane protein
MDALSTIAWAFDASLALGLLWIAWRAVSTSELFEAVVLFVSFGLLMSLAWMRLGAPDIAMAEAAIGAGLTGALLMTALAGLDRGEVEREEDEDREREGRP